MSAESMAFGLARWFRRQGVAAPPDPPAEFQTLLDAAKHGNHDAWSLLMRVVYSDLRRMAQRHRYQQGPGTSLNTTGLVHESYLRLAGSVRETVVSRAHFFALSARIMRQVMCDYARERIAGKRGGGYANRELRDWDAADQSEAETLVQLDRALEALERKNPAWARVVECRFFAGLSEQETAEALGVSVRTTQRYWCAARDWLARKLGG